MKFYNFAIIVLIVFSIFYGCASVPKEVVELSYRTGEDLAFLYESYGKLIHEYYNGMRNERISYLDKTWYPRFLRNWMERGELTAIAKGEKIWSDKEGKLIETPPGTDPHERFALWKIGSIMLFTLMK